jgi:uncharacterized membrane protein
MENIYGEQAPDGLTSKRILSFTRIDILVGGLEPWIFMTFHSVGNFIIPTDELHHFSEG